MRSGGHVFAGPRERLKQVTLLEAVTQLARGAATQPPGSLGGSLGEGGRVVHVMFGPTPAFPDSDHNRQH